MKKTILAVGIFLTMQQASASSFGFMYSGINEDSAPQGAFTCYPEYQNEYTCKSSTNNDSSHAMMASDTDFIMFIHKGCTFTGSISGQSLSGVYTCGPDISGRWKGFILED